MDGHSWRPGPGVEPDVRSFAGFWLDTRPPGHPLSTMPPVQPQGRALRDPQIAAKKLSGLLPTVPFGLEFIPENGGGAGIRFPKREG